MTKTNESALDDLPPGCEKEGGRIVRRVPVLAGDGTTYTQVRPVVLSMEEARVTKADYYDPVLGWIRYGFKLERDRSVESIMADNSLSIPQPIKEE